MNDAEQRLRQLVLIELSGRRLLSVADERRLLATALADLDLSLADARAVVEAVAARRGAVVERTELSAIHKFIRDCAADGKIAKRQLPAIEAVAAALFRAQGTRESRRDRVIALLAAAGIRLRQGYLYLGPRSWYATCRRLRGAGSAAAEAGLRMT
jgi:hypothetical protein